MVDLIRRQRYTSYSHICVYMHIAKTLPKKIILAHEDTEWVQPLDYEHVPFRCQKCHEHDHIYWHFHKNKIYMESIPLTDDEGLNKVMGK